MNSSVWVEIEQGPIDEVTELNPSGRQKCSPSMGENHTEPSKSTKYRNLDGILLDTKDKHLEYITKKIKTEAD